MSYVVVREFADKEDDYHVYKAGDKFPRSGKTVGQQRLNVLLSDANDLHIPLILKEIEPETPVQPQKAKKKK